MTLRVRKLRKLNVEDSLGACGWQLDIDNGVAAAGGSCWVPASRLIQADHQAAGWWLHEGFQSSLVETEPSSEWGPVSGRLTARYGGCTYAMCPHWGIDIAGAPGTPTAVASYGVVAAVGWDPDGYGPMWFSLIAAAGRRSVCTCSRLTAAALG